MCCAQHIVNKEETQCYFPPIPSAEQSGYHHLNFSQQEVLKGWWKSTGVPHSYGSTGEKHSADPSILRFCAADPLPWYLRISHVKSIAITKSLGDSVESLGRYRRGCAGGIAGDDYSLFQLLLAGFIAGRGSGLLPAELSQSR